MWRGLTVAVLVWCCAGVSGLCQDRIPAALSKVKATYYKAKAAIDKKHDTLAEGVAAKYPALLKTGEKAMMNKGDLDGVMAIRKEMSRFQKTNKLAVNGSGEEELHTAVRKAREYMQDSVGKIEAMRKKDYDDLNGRYVNGLKIMARRFTRQGQTEEAEAVRMEIRRIVPETAPPKVEPPAQVVEEPPADVTPEVEPPPVKPPDEPEVVKAPPTPKDKLPGNLQKGLTSFFPFDEPDTGGMIVDLGSSGTRAVVLGAKYVEKGRKGAAYEFDGVDDYIHLGEAGKTDAGEPYSVTLWARPKSLYEGGDGAFFILSRHAGDLGTQFCLEQRVERDQNFLAFRVEYRKPDAVGVIKTKRITRPAWVHLAATEDGRGKSRFYVDGRVVAIRSNTGTRGAGGDATIAGGSIGDNYWGGVLDEIMIYNRVLSPDEIRQIHGLGVGD